MAIKITQQEFENKFGNQMTTPTPLPTSGLGGQIKDAFKSGVGQIKESFQQAKTATNPIQAIESGIKFGTGAVNTIWSPLAPAFKPVEKGINAIANKVSDIPAVQKFAQSKAGEVTERVAGDVAGLSNIAGEAATFHIPLPEVKVPNVVKPIMGATGRVLKSMGEKTTALTVVPEEATTQAVRKYNAKQPSFISRVKNVVTGNEPIGKPITEANTAVRNGLFGTEKELGVQATRLSDELWKQEIQPKLSAVKGAVNMKDFLSGVRKEISSSPTGVRKGQLLDALSSIEDSFKNVNTKVNLETLQKYKEDWAKFIPDSAYKGKTPGAALKEVQSLMAKKARQVIYKHVGEEGKQAYIDYGNLQSIMKSADRSIKDPAKQSLGRDIWQKVMDVGVTPIATFGGKILYKTGEGLELVGNKGATKVGEVIGEKNPPKP